jgi:hypothetical protein
MKLNLSFALLLSALCCSVEGAKPAFTGKVRAVLGKKIVSSEDRLLASDVQQRAAEGIEFNGSSHNLQVRGGASSSMIENLTICFYFLTWYALNVVYNSKFLSFLFILGFGK